MPTACRPASRKPDSRIITAIWKRWATTCWPITAAIADSGMTGKALAAELPFQLAHRFRLQLAGGWLDNQQARPYERDLIMVIPGRDRRRAVIMADHYDTAYMEDVFGADHGGGGARLAAGRRGRQPFGDRRADARRAESFWNLQQGTASWPATCGWCT